MIVRNNVMGLRAYNANRKTTNSITKNLEKLSSGYRINRAGDDAAGLAVSERLRAKITELDRSVDNAYEGMDLARTADAALQEVNDMLKRARNLCLQAANGTYSDQELSAISTEMNQLFDEIDRISASTYYSSICLFRGELEEEEVHFHYEYDEVFEALGDGNLQLWGEVDFIQSTPFEKAVDPIPATATFTLSDEIDFDDPATLEGKSIQIGSRTYYFTSGNSVPSGSIRILVGKDSDAVENALVALGTASSVDDVQSVKVDKDARTVTLTAVLKDLSERIEADGQTFNSVAEDGSGAAMNGILVDNPLGSNSILQVDGEGISNNEAKSSNKFIATYPLTTKDTLSAEDVANLVKNTLWVYNDKITFTTSTPSSPTEVAISANMTKAALGAAIATAISSIADYTANYDTATSSLKVEYTSSGSVSSSMDIFESTSTITSGEKDPDSSHTWTSTALGFSVHTTSSSMERGGSCTVSLSAIPTNSAFSIEIGSTTYLYYNSDRDHLTSTGYNSTQYTGYSGSLSPCDTKTMSTQQIQNDIISKIRSYANSYLNNVNISTSGNSITVTSTIPNRDVSLSVSKSTVTVTPYKPGTYSSRVLNSSYHYFEGEFEIPFSLNADFDEAKKELIGRGFSLASSGSSLFKNFEFTNGDSGLQSSYYDVDISNCSSFDDIAAALQMAIQAHVDSSYSVKVDTSGSNDVKLLITGSYDTTSSSRALPSVIDGNEGITDGTPVKFEGGTNINHSQVAIDFSSINASNLDTLLGKGFRINCATCSGEYINVFFCWTNDGNAPESFQKPDPVTGEIRTIHNVAVELSKVTSGDKIVESIVEQVRPSLTHYTDLLVGDPPTTLIAMEKRLGNVQDNNNQTYLGAVENGVQTNFSYSVSLKQVFDDPDPGSDFLKTYQLDIYVGADPGPQLIPIHLPYIDKTALGLAPPERVNLNDSDQSASDWLNRVDSADLAISGARGTIGADYNRLEHAIQDLSNTHIQLTDAYSVIRDADIAELTVQQVKDEILFQAQQAMLSQANQLPQGVLQLMQ